MAVRLIFRLHAVRRMMEREVTVEDVSAVIEADERIEDYPDDFPYPSALFMGTVGGRPLHVVAARIAEDEAVIITVYEPSLEEWEEDLRTRRRT